MFKGISLTRNNTDDRLFEQSKAAIIIEVKQFLALSTVAQKGQSQISLPKHKTISQNTNQFPKTEIDFSKHKSISQNTNQFAKTQNNCDKLMLLCTTKKILNKYYMVAFNFLI